MLEFLDAFPLSRVLIVGDLMLDEYIWGDVNRISPEAPVPVVRENLRTFVPGGAANVAANVRGFGAQVFLGGVLGADYAGEKLRHILTQQQVDITGLLVDDNRPTTTKTRIVARNQQLLRVDSEQNTPLSADFEEALLAWAHNILPQVKACVLSDYAKGVLSHRVTTKLIFLAREIGCPIIVDPKGKDYSKYRNATLVTPNLHEVEQASNMELTVETDLLLMREKLAQILGDGALLITRGAQGMSLFENGCEAVYLPAIAHQVFDVTGAGDTVIGALATALAAGASLQEATYLANYAAGIVVGKVGTAVVSVDELRHLFHAEKEHYPIGERHQ